jgi:molybdopterin/thiamine biosynthesis adenylyltransferase
MVHRSLPVIVQWVDMATWWERYPDLLEAEQVALNAGGHTWVIDEVARHAGQLVIFVDYPNEDGKIWKLRAEYPETYPYFPPAVFLSEVVLPRHHHPIGKNLCLMARNGEDWLPSHDSLATLLAEQLPKILKIKAVGETAVQPSGSSEHVVEQEDNVGEPLSSFLEYAPNSVIIVPDDVPGAEQETGRLAVIAKPTSPHERAAGNISGVLSSILDQDRTPLVSFGVKLPSHTLNLDGFWMRLPGRPAYSDADAFRLGLYQRMTNSIPGFKRELMSSPSGRTFITGFLYEDETTWRMRGHDWLFLLIIVQQKAKNRNSLPPVTIIPVRADWGGEAAWMQRAPMLAPLRKKTVVLFGAGSLGSPVALHLARAGVGELVIIDEDHLQVGNTIRWALGWQHAGQDKVVALASYIAHNYPYTKASGHKFLLGLPNFELSDANALASDYDLIRQLVARTDVLIDASASHRVSHFLSDLAVELGKPYLWLTTTHGCAGGVVGRYIPGSGQGCWHCYNLRLADGSLPLPPSAESEEIQPGGCSQATFIGAGIDSEEISLMASRLAVATLCCGSEGYQDFNWNIGICEAYRGGVPIAPSWYTSALDVHPECHICCKK